jgi:hypothetical protein
MKREISIFVSLKGRSTNIALFSNIIDVGKINWRLLDINYQKFVFNTRNDFFYCILTVSTKDFRLHNLKRHVSGDFDYMGDDLVDYIGSYETSFGEVIGSEDDSDSDNGSTDAEQPTKKEPGLDVAIATITGTTLACLFILLSNDN